MRRSRGEEEEETRKLCLDVPCRGAGIGVEEEKEDEQKRVTGFLG